LRLKFPKFCLFSFLLFLLVVVGFMGLPIVGASDTEIASYDVSVNTGFNFRRVFPSNDGYYSAVGETFISPSSLYKITSVKFSLCNIGSPTGMLDARLYLMGGTYGVNGTPTGSALAYSGLINVSSLGVYPTYSFQEFIFNATNQYILSVSTAYCIVCCVYSGSYSSSNYVMCGGKGTTGAYAGNEFHYFGGAWAVLSSCDLVFYVYGLIYDVYSLSYSDISSNSTMLGSVANFSVSWSSNGTLSSFVFGWNFSGSWVDDGSVNFAGSSSPQWSNVSKSLGENVSMWHFVVLWRVNATGQGGKVNDTGLQSFVLSAVVVTYYVPDLGVLNVNGSSVSNSSVVYACNSSLVVGGLPSSGYAFYNFTRGSTYFNSNPATVTFPVSNFMTDVSYDLTLVLGVGGGGYGEGDLSDYFWFGVLLCVVVLEFVLILYRRKF